MLKIRVLVDNNTLVGKYFTGEPGFCLWIEDGDYKVLFDLGYSGIFIDNAREMGIDCDCVDALVISHGHSDHTWGISRLLEHYNRSRVNRRPDFVAHPLAVERKLLDGFEAGFAVRQEVLAKYFNLRLSSSPLRLTERLLWLGEIPASVQPRVPLGSMVVDGVESPDFCLDDSALVYEGVDGLVVISGCSHSGICNIVDYAVKLTGVTRIADVIGGFHLQRVSDEKMNFIVDWFANNPPVCMHPCHCTDFYSKVAFARRFDVREVGVGDEFIFD
ncbi:MAG: MBL fold metallo-hydrolase [Synergistaceae bacterium]